MRDDVGAVTVCQHDHVGRPPRRGRCHLLQVRQRAYPHRTRAGPGREPPGEQNLPVRRDHDSGAARQGLAGADGQRLGGALIGTQPAGLAGSISPGHIPRIRPVSRRIRHRDRGGHHQAGCGRTRLQGAQRGVQLQPAEPQKRKRDHRLACHGPITAGGQRAGQYQGIIRIAAWRPRPSGRGGNAAGRWHVAFAVIPGPIPAPGTGEVAGIDRGVVVSAALSTGDLLHAPGLTARERTRLRRMQRRLARAERGSNRRGRLKHAMARLRARETDRRKDWAEKISTGIARRFDVIRVEDLQITNMTRSARGTRGDPGRNVAQKAGLNRGILRSGWGLLVRRLQDKAPDRVEKVKPHYTSQRCSACGQVDRDSRESQAVFRCTACGYACNADVNAAKNIAAGHAVTARGGDGVARPVNREPQLLLPSA